MSDIAIRVDNVSKRYRLGEGQAFDNVRDAVAHAAKAPLRWLGRGKNGNGSTAVAERDEILWALRDVSFEVKRGEVLGIIGRNGAGKSTLLKILSRITEPSDGTIDVFGRVASLLEVGTGFHQDLTGRENIYLNGSILGMTKREIDRKFDEIVAFAGVERFIDTPVKRYSSGMGVRLGFAVAAHLEPEILIVDEVLAVGDAEFQRKCLGKMDDVARSGRTVLFVSHNMVAVEGLCTAACFLQDGELVVKDSTDNVIARYMKDATNATSDTVALLKGSRGVVESFCLMGPHDRHSSSIAPGEDVIFCLHVNPPKRCNHLRIAIRIFDHMGQRVATCHSEYQHPHKISIDSRSEIRCVLQNCRLAPGRYTVVLELDEHRDVLARLESALNFEVVPRDIYATGKLMPPNTGLYLPETAWTIRACGGESVAPRETPEQLATS